MEERWENEAVRRRALALPLLYFCFYMLGFLLLEEHVHPRYWISSDLDAYIPFCAAFLIPYLAWFPMVVGMYAYFYRRDPESYLSLCRGMVVGLTICLALYAIFPNGQLLRRPIQGEDLLSQLVRLLRRMDTPTNVCPSIHVFVTVTVALTAGRSRAMARQRLLRGALMVLWVLICLSTVFLKQHSVVDVALGAALALVLDLIQRQRRPESWFLFRLLQPRDRRTALD